MTLLIILACVFAGVALIVVLSEKFGKPMDTKEQAKLSKIAMFLVFALIIAGIIRMMM